MSPPVPEFDPVISATGLTRIYSLGTRDVVGLKRVALSIPAGALVVLKGNSGSGKSTLLSLLAGLDHPTDGSLTVAGHDLAPAPFPDLTRYRREVVGMVFQAFNLLPTLTVLENVTLPALLSGTPFGTARPRTLALLSWLCLSDRTDHYPSQLSGGEMQRTALARALINDPAVILADEPTGNLDTRNGEIVISLLARLNRDQGRTVIIATHSDMADDVATHRIFLRDGEVQDSPCPA